MGLFKRKKKEIEVVVEVDSRTDLEKSFEEKGQSVGRETGKIVQKGMDKVNKLKVKFDADEKIEKVKVIKDKATKSVDDFVVKTKHKAGEVVNKVKSKKEN